MSLLPRCNVAPLLSRINGRPRSDEIQAPREPEDVTALPLSESDEAEDEPAQPSQARYIDSSDDELFGSADLPRTHFVQKAASKAQAETRAAKDTNSASDGNSKMKRRSTRQARSSNPKKRVKDDIEDDEAAENDIFASNKKAKKTGIRPSAELGNHMHDGWSVKAKDPEKPKFKYSLKKAAKSQESMPLKKFESRKISQTPETKKTFKMPILEPFGSSPTAPDFKPWQRLESRDGESSPLSSLSSDPPRPLEYFTEEKKPRRQRRNGRKGFQRRDPTPEEVSQRPEFKMPAGYDDFAPNSELVDFDLPLHDTPIETRPKLGPGQALCPMCEETVDGEMLKEFSKGRRMGVSRQVKFCRLHKKKTAQKIWEERCYPSIDWKGLKQRIEGHHSQIEALILGEASESHFGSILQEKIRTGKNRTLLQTEDYLTPGYYGLRGMSLMTETIVEMFSSLLRKRAPQDKLISARGYTGFVQSVLVPELAVKLIEEDLSLSSQEARAVMQESRAVGEALCDEKRDSEVHPQVHDDGDGAGDGAGEVQEEKNEKSDDEVSVELKIQEVADSDSESDLSSIATKGNKKTSVDKVQVTTQVQEVADSDSDLTSVDGM